MKNYNVNISLLSQEQAEEILAFLELKGKENEDFQPKIKVESSPILDLEKELINQ
jgi:hypothetical protein